MSLSLVINVSLHRKLLAAGVLKDDPVALLVKEPIGGLAYALRKLDYVLAAIRLCLWLVRHKPRLMHLVLGGAYIALPAQALGWAPPALVSVVCPSLREMVGSTLGLMLYRRALKSARLVDVLTESIKVTLLGEGIRAERIRCSSGSCVDTVRFRPAQSKRPWVVFSGRLIDEKNPLLFVEACALVRERRSDARFFLLGDGPLRHPVEELLRKRGLESRTQVGWRQDVEVILGEALVLASLQRMDNYPSQALLEAMACGAAVVATDVGLTAKLVDDSVGVLVPADPAEVADAITRLLTDPVETEARGRRGRELVLREHSMDRYLAYLEGLYAHVGELRGRQPAYAAATDTCE